MRNYLKIMLLSVALVISSTVLPLESNLLKTEVQAESLSIETNLEDGLVTKSDKLTFDLFAKDSNGLKISPSHIKVTNNEESVRVNWDDDTKTSYTLDLNVGKNEILIAIDFNGKKASKTYSITREDAKEGDVIGQYVFAIEGFSIGLDYIVEPVLVDLKMGQSASYALHDELTANGFKYDYTGSLDNSFYLATLLDGDNKIYKKEPKIPEVLLEKVDADATDYNEGELGEFDFNYMSGWMYSVNNTFPNVGFADFYLKDKDVMRVQFTLAYGSDLGGGWGHNYFEAHDKGPLTTEIAKINSSDKKDVYLSNSEIKKRYEKSLASLYRVDALQKDLNENSLILAGLIANFDEKEIVYDELKQLIESAEALDLEGRLDSEKGRLQSSLADAKKGIEANTLSVKEAEKLADSITKSIDRLNKTAALDKEVSNAKQLDLTGYTEESKLHLQNKLEKAETLLKEINITEELISRMQNELSEAIANLEVKLVTEEEIKQLLDESINKAIRYAENEFPDYTNNKTGSHSDYWAFSALWGAGIKDLENEFAWKSNVKPSAAHTFWSKKLSKPNTTSNEDAGTIIGSVLLGLSPTDFGTQNVVKDLESKQKENGSFFTIWGEPWAMIALELVDSEAYNKDKHIEYILGQQNTNGMFGGADSTGWILTALAPYKKTHPSVAKALDKSISYIHSVYKETGKLPGMNWGENSNSLTSLHMGLAANGENLLSEKWTHNENMIYKFIKEYQFDDGSYAWQKGSSTGSLRMSTEQVLLGLATVREQESIFTKIKQEVDILDKTQLKELIEKAKNLDTSGMTEASVQGFDSALESAETVLANEKASQAEVDAALEALTEAIESLEEIPVNKQLLEKKVEEVKALDLTGYTEASVQAFDSALESAETVLANEKASQAEVDAALEALTKAIESLEEIPVDKQLLEKKVEEAKALDLTGYTEASLQGFDSALESAETVLANEKASQAEVDAALEALTKAIESLEEIPVDKQLLEEKVEEAKALDLTGYTEASVQGFDSALESAETVLANEKASQAEVDAALETLTEAIDNLEKKVLENLVLESIVKPQDIEVPYGTLESEIDFPETLELVLSNKEVKQVDVEWVFKTRTGFNGELPGVYTFEGIYELPENVVGEKRAVELKVTVLEEEKEVDKSRLSEVLAKAKATPLDGKTEETIKALKDAIADAEKIMTRPDASESEVVAAINALENGILNLQDIPKVVVDKTELTKQIAQAEKLDKDKYTEASFDQLQEVLGQARVILVSEEASQEMVDAIVKALKLAEKELVVKEEETVEPGTPEEPKEPEAPEEEQTDLTELEAVIKTAEKIDVTNKTQASKDAFEASLEAGRQIVSKDNPTEEEVKAAIKAILDAIKALEDQVLAPQLAYITEVSPITVKFGTKESELKLPNSITLNLSDQTTRNVAVDWTLKSGNQYNGEKAGQYIFVGNYELPEGISGEKLPVEFTVTVEKKVEEKPKEEAKEESKENLNLKEKDDPRQVELEVTPLVREESVKKERTDTNKTESENLEESKQEKLPNTATYLYNTLLVGLLFLVMGLLIAYSNRRKFISTK